MDLDKEIISLKEIILKLNETYGKPGSSLKRELWASFNALNEAINYKSSCDALPCEICGSTEHKKFDNPSCNCVPN